MGRRKVSVFAKRAKEIEARVFELRFNVGIASARVGDPSDFRVRIQNYRFITNMLAIDVVISWDNEKRLGGEADRVPDFVEPLICPLEFLRLPVIGNISCHQERIKIGPPFEAQITN